MTETLKLFTTWNVFAGLLASAAFSLFLTWLKAPRYPKDIPWVGTGKSRFAAFSEIKDWIQNGYEVYSKADTAFVIPGLLGTHPEIAIPRSQMAWMLDQPDHVISTAAAHYDSLNGDYSFVERAILGDPYHEHVIHRTLARHLTSLVPAIDKQVRLCADDIYGTNEGEWKTINIWDSLMELVPRVTNCILVGRPLCENEEYLSGAVGFSLSVTRDLVTFPTIPTIIKPIICPIMGLSSRFNYWKTAKHSVPLIKERLANMAAKEAGDPTFQDWTPPNDYITWHIDIAKAEGRIDELKPQRIALRLLPLNFGAIHTTVIIGLAAFLDMLAHDEEQIILESIRDEVAQVATEQPDGYWTKAGLAKLHRLDSAIRESMRVSGFSQTMISRKVIAREGVTNPTTGQHFSYGTMLSALIWGVQHDRDIYGDAADRYDAFRFSRQRESYEARSGPEKNPDEGLKIAKMAMVTTSSEHFAFGHGRHAWQVAHTTLLACNANSLTRILLTAPGASSWHRS